MGDDAFASLGLPRRLALSLDEIEARWRELSREAHPDAATGNADHAAEINRAYEVLRNAGSRLRHWLELNGVDIPRNASIDEDLMTQFGEVGAVIASADAFLIKKKAASSAIARALLSDEEFTVQKAIQGRMADLKGQIEGIAGQFDAFEEDHSAALRGLEKLRFLEKWFQQCQERLVGLMSL